MGAGLLKRLLRVQCRWGHGWPRSPARATPWLSAATYSTTANPVNVPLLTFFVLQLPAPA
jgi:hypothetical protein